MSERSPRAGEIQLASPDVSLPQCEIRVDKQQVMLHRCTRNWSSHQGHAQICRGTELWDHLDLGWTWQHMARCGTPCNHLAGWQSPFEHLGFVRWLAGSELWHGLEGKLMDAGFVSASHVTW